MLGTEDKPISTIVFDRVSIAGVDKAATLEHLESEKIWFKDFEVNGSVFPFYILQTFLRTSMEAKIRRLISANATRLASGDQLLIVKEIP